jgi:hypothetical protein
MYRNMSQHDFDIQVEELTGTARLKVALYKAKAMREFVKDGKFDLYSQFISSIEI